MIPKDNLEGDALRDGIETMPELADIELEVPEADRTEASQYAPERPLKPSTTVRP